MTTKLVRTPGIPGSPRLLPLKDGVSPEQGNYYAQDIVARLMIPLRKLFTPSKYRTNVDNRSVTSVLTAILRGNSRSTPGQGRVYPLNASELNSPQKVRRPVLRKAR